ncbi:MAG: cyclase family protein [Candidatus Fermentibacteraceae bacterium]|nr:cyclase family protein [Candidatus Fermentibacteraceae bacterium]MBN2608182.1 cyclase family protein [Candidatus Fermentibacteraceae bacterium]
MFYTIDPEGMIDITMPLSKDTPCWPGDTPFRREVREEHGFRTSRMVMSTHSGTHMDSPAHLCRCSATIDLIPPSGLVLPALVIDLHGKVSVTAADLKNLPLDGRALLLRTAPEFPPDDLIEYGHLTADAAQMAVEGGARLVGIDTLSVDAPDCDLAHGILLEGSIPVVENLVLGHVHPGEYLLLCFPLRIIAGDGSPVRAFLHPLMTAEE